MRKIKRRREGQANETLQVYLVNTHGEILVPVTIKSLVCYRYLQICRVINFMPGIARAHFYLGDIESQFKRYQVLHTYPCSIYHVFAIDARFKFKTSWLVIPGLLRVRHMKHTTREKKKTCLSF